MSDDREDLDLLRTLTLESGPSDEQRESARRRLHEEMGRSGGAARRRNQVIVASGAIGALLFALVIGVAYSTGRGTPSDQAVDIPTTSTPQTSKPSPDSPGEALMAGYLAQVGQAVAPLGVHTDTYTTHSVVRTSPNFMTDDPASGHATTREVSTEWADGLGVVVATITTEVDNSDSGMASVDDTNPDPVVETSTLSAQERPLLPSDPLLLDRMFEELVDPDSPVSMGAQLFRAAEELANPAWLPSPTARALLIQRLAAVADRPVWGEDGTLILTTMYEQADIGQIEISLVFDANGYLIESQERLLEAAPTSKLPTDYVLRRLTQTPPIW